MTRSGRNNDGNCSQKNTGFLCLAFVRGRDHAKFQTNWSVWKNSNNIIRSQRDYYNTTRRVDRIRGTRRWCVWVNVSMPQTCIAIPLCFFHADLDASSWQFGCANNLNKRASRRIQPNLAVRFNASVTLLYLLTWVRHHLRLMWLCLRADLWMVLAVHQRK